MGPSLPRTGAGTGISRSRSKMSPTAFAVVVAAGGAAHGKVVTRDIPGAGRVTFAYVRDPEGNLVELQSWE